MSERTTDLEAGPELGVGHALDALVAERVYGHRVVWLRNAAQQRSPWIFDNAEVVYDVRGTGQAWVRGITDDDWEVFHRGSRPVPRYSADVAAAWQVVETLRARHLHLDIGSTVRGSMADIRRGVPHGQWTVGIRGRHYTARCDTMPHAVCLVALEAGDAKGQPLHVKG